MRNKIIQNKFVAIGITLIMLVIVGTVLASDQKFILSGKIKSEIQGASAPVIRIKELRAGAATKTINVAQSGRFRIELDYQTKYSVSFESNGHYTKIIQISTTIPREVFEQDSFFPPFPIEVALFGIVEGVVDDFSNKPIGTIFYSEDYDEFDAEVTLTDKDIKEKLDVKNHEFLALVKQGDDAVVIENYEEALNFYNKALEIKSNREVKSKRDKIVERFANLETISNLMAEGQISYDEKQWSTALEIYSKIVQLDSTHSLALRRIKEIKEVVEQENLAKEQEEQRQQQISQLLSKATTLFEKQEWNSAKVKYNEVLTLDATNTTATAQLEIINEKLNALAEQKEEYQSLLSAGDKAFVSKNYPLALEKFESAVALQPNESYPKNQIDLIKRAQMDEVARDKKFETLKIKGKSEYDQQNLTESKEFLTKAILIKSDDEIARWLVEIDTQLANSLKEKEGLEHYKNLIKKADSEYALLNFTEAIQSYRSALAIKNKENYPTVQIAKAEEQIEKNSQYNLIITDADNAFNDSNYTKAILVYEKALSIKPAESYPKSQIIKSKGKISDIETLYAQTIAKADKQFALKNYMQAIGDYDKASAIKNEEEYPKLQIKKAQTKLEEIDAKYAATIETADKEFTASQFLNAITYYEKALALKPEESYPKGQIAKAKSKIADSDALYVQTLEKADALFENNNFAQAIAIYQEAIVMKSEEQYPEDQIAKAKIKIEEKNKAYDKIIALADSEFAQKNFTAAITSYEKALSIKSDEEYPQTQIAKAQSEISDTEALYAQTISKADTRFDTNDFLESIALYEEASKINTSKKYPKEQITKAKLKIAENKQLYNKAIVKADNEFATKNFKLAIATYESALVMGQEEAYPQTQIAKAKEEIGAMNRKYDETIAIADKEFLHENYLSAITTYKKALSIKSDEEYPKEQIVKAQTKISNSEELFAQTIEKANLLFNGEQYVDAITIYETALTMKPNEQYPQNQISKAKDKIKTSEETYARKIEMADQSFAKLQYEKSIVLYEEALLLKEGEKYPEQRIAKAKFELGELNSNYQNLISLGDEEFVNSKFEASISTYEKALVIKPTELYPKEQIEKAKTEIQNSERLYAQTVEKADNQFENKAYDKAIVLYNQALTIKPEVEYPQKQLQKIEANAQRLNEEFSSTVQKADALYNKEEYLESIAIYKLALKMKPSEEYPAFQITKAENQIAEIEAEYQKTINQANAQFKAKQYKEAIELYNAALVVRENDSFAEQRKKLCETKILDLEKAMAAVENQVKKADEAFEKAEYRNAILIYNKVLNAVPEHKHASERIEKANKEISLLLDSEFAAEIEQHKEKAEQSESDNKHQLAIQYYKKILALEPNSKETKANIVRLQKEIEVQNQEKLNVDFTKNLKLAQESEQKGNIRNALFYYKKALGYAPNHEETKNKITEIEKELAK